MQLDYVCEGGPVLGCDIVAWRRVSLTRSVFLEFNLGGRLFDGFVDKTGKNKVDCNNCS